MRDDGVIGKIEKQEWLMPAEEGLQKVVHQAFGFRGGRQVKNFLHGTWIGHPLHVILTDVPIGAWTVAIAFDALDSMSARRQYSIAADTAVALGLVGAAGAAATGLTDWQDIDPPARRIGLVHGLLDVASVVLFGSSLLVRRRGNRTTGPWACCAWLRHVCSCGSAGWQSDLLAKNRRRPHCFRKAARRVHTCAAGIRFRRGKTNTGRTQWHADSASPAWLADICPC